MSGNEPSLEVVIKSKSQIATNIYQFELVRTDGAALPGCELGSHISVEVPSGAHRWYSICDVTENSQSYFIAVKREAGGRGGSD